MIATLFLLAISTATIRPAAPSVGDLITVELEQPMIVQPSPSYEIVSQRGKRVVVRTFEPKPFLLRGPNLIVPVRSVLKPKDDLKPAPLQPPRLGPPPKLPLILIALAALVAALIWTAVILLGRERATGIVPIVAPEERFRTIVVALSNDPHRRQRWAALADATRAFLAATRPHFGAELTTSEILEWGGHAAALGTVAHQESGGMPPALQIILMQGDLEKFSPWGARPMDFSDVANRALALIPNDEEVAA